MHKRTFILLTLCLLCAWKAHSQITCVLSGKVIDRPYSTTLLLFSKHADPRIEKPIEISIQDGKFSYKLQIPEVRIYTLCFLDEYMQGSMRIFDFVAENDTVRFELYPSQNRKNNTITGGVDQKRYQHLMSGSVLTKELDSLQEYLMEFEYTDQAYNEEGRKVFTLLKEAFAKEDRATVDSLNTIFKKMQRYSACFLELQQRIEDLSQAEREWLSAQLENDCNPVGLAILYNQFWRGIIDEDTAVDLNRLQGIYRGRYKKQYPASELCRQIETLLIGAKVRQGAPFEDFTAPDLKGVMHRLSDEIEGRVAVLDLWASWCGPCMRLSQSLIPLYEKYKGKGFTIVGVARESNNTQAMKKAIERLRLPWLNLIDLNDQLSIWRKYGVGNGGGKIFLIDSTGKILLVHPSAEEIEKELQKLLN